MECHFTNGTLRYKPLQLPEVREERILDRGLKLSRKHINPLLRPWQSVREERIPVRGLKRINFMLC